MPGLPKESMEGLPNFPLEFQRIGNYLQKAPKASTQELKAAREAYSKIVEAIYGGTITPKCAGTFPVIVNFS